MGRMAKELLSTTASSSICFQTESEGVESTRCEHRLAKPEACAYSGILESEEPPG